MFNHLSAEEYSLQTILCFLDNPSLNPGEARNLERLPDRIFPKFCGIADSDSRLCTWIRQKIHLGLLSSEELSQLLRNIRAFRKRSGNIYSIKTAVKPTYMFFRHFLNSILEGLDSSSVFKVTNIDDFSLDYLLTNISHESISHDVQLLGLRVIGSCNPSQRDSQLYRIGCVLQWCFISWNQSEKQQKIKMEHAIDSLILQWLQRLPTSSMSILISRVCSGLLGLWYRDGRIRLASPDALQRWSSIMSKMSTISDTLNLEIPTMAISQDASIISRYLRFLEEKDRLLFISREFLTKNNQLLNQFEKQYLQKTASAFVDLLRVVTLQPSSTPPKKMHLMFDVLTGSGLRRTLLDIISSFETGKFRLKRSILISAINKYAGVHSQSAHDIFRAAPRLRLQEVPSLAEAMIADPLLIDSRAFDHVWTGESCDQNLRRFWSTPEDVGYFRLLERMAFAYARALHLSPRCSLAKVQRCYGIVCFKHKRSSRDISRALIMAGVLRPLRDGTGVSETQVQWVMSKVRMIEGDEVADRSAVMIDRWMGDIRKCRWERRRDGSGDVFGRAAIETPPELSI